MTIKEMAQTLLEIRQEVDLKKELLDEAKARKEEMSNQIMETLKAQGFASVKVEGTSIAIAHRKTFKITDEKLVIELLKEKGLAKEYVESVERLTEFAPKAIELLAKEQEVAGTETTETEYISIRNTKKDEE
jgi:excinuclease UvrABC ATPase subunit